MSAVEIQPTVISFDYWNTIGRSNATYSQARVDLLYRTFADGLDMDLDGFRSVFSEVNNQVESLTEETGEHMGLDKRLTALCERLGVAAPDAATVDQVQTELEKLSEQFPAQLYSEWIPGLFERIKAAGIDTAIVTNTGMMSVRAVMRQIEIQGLSPDYFLSSELTGATKPSHRAYQALLDMARDHHPDLQPDQILHVGDNKLADYEGARAVGFAALHASLDAAGVAAVEEHLPNGRFRTYALHEVAVTNAGVEIDGGSTDSDEFLRRYGLLKYGDGRETLAYAEELADRLLQEGKAVPGQRLYVSGSAFEHTPTAADSLAHILTQILHDRGVDAHYFGIKNESATNRAPHRDSKAPSGDYSSLSVASRRKVLERNPPIISEVTAAEIKGQNVVTIDDMLTTGMHRDQLRDLFMRAGVGSATFAYIARIDTRQGQETPHVEGQINETHMKHLDDLLPIARGEQFIPNVRVCRFIMRPEHRSELEAFAEQVPLEHLETIIGYMVADSIHEQPGGEGVYALIQIAERRQHGRN